MNRTRDKWRQNPEEQFESENPLFEETAREAAGRIIPVATVAKRVFDRLARPEHDALVEGLDESSTVMIETSLTTGHFLETVERGKVPEIKPLRFNRTRETKHEQSIDYSAGAIGVWKALEWELNKSLIQACRKSRGIDMPSFYMRHAPNLPDIASIVITGRRTNGDPFRNDINLLDRNHKPYHKLFTLGQGWHVVKTLLDKQEESLNTLVKEILGEPLPSLVLDYWKAIHTIRNKASHVQPIWNKDYQKVLDMGLHPKLLSPLIVIKRAMQT